MPAAALLDQPHEHLSLEKIADGEEALSELLISVRRHLHRHPEIGMREEATSRFIRETLDGYGLRVHGPVAKTGLWVNIEGEGRPADASGPASWVGYRADIDALPMQDAKAVSYHSTREGVAHLCGHDAHTAIAIGVALLLHARRADLPGSARVFFQPNEEGVPSGAPLMIEAGVLEGLKAVYATHVDPTLDAGRYGLKEGPITAASDRFDVTVRGEGSGHSARPHETVDTVWVANQIMQAFYQLAGRITDPRNAAVLTICRMAGGEAYNVIPPASHFGGTLRTISEEDRTFFREKMRRVAEETAALYGGAAALDMQLGSPPVVNDERAVEAARSAIEKRFGTEAIYDIPRPSMGAEDFSHYLREVPGALIRTGTRSGPDTRYPLHDGRFDLDEGILAPTARLMADLLESRLRKGL